MSQSNYNYFNWLTPFEYAKLIGDRSAQLDNNAESLIDYGNLTTSNEIAVEEYKKGMIPLILVRTLPNGGTVRIKFVPKKKK